MSDEIPKGIGELRWRPVGTHRGSSTTPSEPVVKQLKAKAFVHKRTSLKDHKGFLILQVGEEEAIVGPVGDERSLGELFEKRRPKRVRLSCSDLLRLAEDDDPTEADKELVQGLKHASCASPAGDEGEVFFRDLCSYINDRNLYTTDLSNCNTSLSK